MLAFPLRRRLLSHEALRHVVTMVQPPPKSKYTVVKAVQQVLKGAQERPRKFVESVEIALVMNVDPRKADQIVRGTVSLPHGTGKEGEVRFRTKKTPEISASIGKVDFGEEKIMENLRAFVSAVQSAKPEGATGRQYFKAAAISSTMGKGFRVLVDTIDPRSPKFMQDRE
mmetsp:Transcript_4929/g.19720  ORF Transcript_4929/g.19720 Transcript_4929/m.19720 type:complete len:170 (+) Transcript_4929:51-560(+)